MSQIRPVLSVLPLRPRREAGESARGYAVRLAEANGILRVSTAVAKLGATLAALARGAGLDGVAELSASSPDALARDTPQPGSRHVALRGETLLRRQWSARAARRVCPACLAADLAEARACGRAHLPRAWHRAWWEVTAVTVCPVHAVRLVARCPTCQAELGFGTGFVARCRCGEPLDRIAVEPVEPAWGEAYIVGRLGGSQRLRHAVLDANRLGDAIAAMEVVGGCALDGHAAAEKVGPVDRHLILAAGFHALARTGPDAFDPLFDKLLAGAGLGLGRWGCARAYGPLHAYLAKAGHVPVARLLRDRMRVHAAANGVLSPNTPAFGKPAAHRALTLDQLRGRLRVSHRRARRYLAAGGLLTAPTGSGTPMAIPLGTVARLESRRHGSVDLETVRRELRIGRTQARALVRAGLIEVGTAAEPGLGRHGFAPSAAQRFRGRLGRGLPTRAAAPVGSLPLPKACRSARTPLAVACRALLERRLRPAYRVPSGDGLAGIAVDVRRLREIGKARSASMTLNDAAAQLGVKWQTMKSLVQLGLVSAVGARSISQADLVRFEQVFAKGAELAAPLGMRPQTFLRRAAALGLHPVAGPPDCRQTFFRRAEIVPFLGRIGRQRPHHHPGRRKPTRRVRTSSSAARAKALPASRP